MSNVVVQYLPSYFGVVRNDAVDAAASKALKKYGGTKTRATPLKTVQAEIKRSLVERWKSGLDQEKSHYIISGNKSASLQLSDTLQRQDVVLLRK
jgi:hypothetical protein